VIERENIDLKDSQANNKELQRRLA